MLKVMKLRLDPWATEYNTAYYADEVAQVTPDHIDPYVEHEIWKAVTPIPNDLTWDKLLFIDGSRRIEARLLLENDQEQIAFGAMGTYAIGVVNCCNISIFAAPYAKVECSSAISRLEAVNRIENVHSVPLS